MSKRSKSEPVVARRADGTIYSSERVKVRRSASGHEGEEVVVPTRRAYNLLVKKGIVKP